MKVRDHLQFYGRKKAYKTMLYLSEILNQVLDKDDHVIKRAARYWIIPNLILKDSLKGL